MIGVETLPVKKKGEAWTFDEGARSKVAEFSFIAADNAVIFSL